MNKGWLAPMSESAAETIGERVKRLRGNLKWSQRQLGAKAGTSGAYINQLESGQIPKPGFPILQRIATALQVSVDDLTDADYEAPAEQPNLPPILADTLRDYGTYMDDTAWWAVRGYIARLVEERAPSHQAPIILNQDEDIVAVLKAAQTPMSRTQRAQLRQDLAAAYARGEIHFRLKPGSAPLDLDALLDSIDPPEDEGSVG